MESKNLNQISSKHTELQWTFRSFIDLAKTQKVDLAEISITKLSRSIFRFYKR